MLRHCIPVVALIAVLLSVGVAAEPRGYAQSFTNDMGSTVVDAQIAERKRSGGGRGSGGGSSAGVGDQASEQLKYEWAEGGWVWPCAYS